MDMRVRLVHMGHRRSAKGKALRGDGVSKSFAFLARFQEKPIKPKTRASRLVSSCATSREAYCGVVSPFFFVQIEAPLSFDGHRGRGCENQHCVFRVLRGFTDILKRSRNGADRGYSPL
jgi:hypothetical protein